jgi:hypothetical protein
MLLKVADNLNGLKIQPVTKDGRKSQWIPKVANDKEPAPKIQGTRRV